MQYAPRTKANSKSPSPPSDLSLALKDLLGAMLTEHQTLQSLLTEQRDAIRQADTGAFGSAAERHARTLARIADLESRRMALVASSPIARGRRKSPTLSEIGAALPEPGRSECLALASKLRVVLESTQKATNVLRAASASLLAHMEGMMRQVGRRLSHAGTYGRTGEVEPVASVVTALDLTR
jgi:hypothetical protein